MIKQIILNFTDTYIYLIVDLLAKEYGWSIEYILNLYENVVIGLLKTMKFRHNLEDQIMQLNTAKGFSGKISPNFSNPFKSLEPKENEMKNLETLAKTLKLKVEKVSDG